MAKIVERLHPAELTSEAALIVEGRKRYLVEGPLKESADVETPWGTARAEIGCYVLEDEQTGDKHIVPPDDFEHGYRTA